MALEEVKLEKLESLRSEVKEVLDFREVVKRDQKTAGECLLFQDFEIGEHPNLGEVEETISSLQAVRNADILAEIIGIQIDTVGVDLSEVEDVFEIFEDIKHANAAEAISCFEFDQAPTLDLEDTFMLASEVDIVEGLTEEVSCVSDELEETEREAKSVIKEIGRFKSCPLCGNKI
jgi:hypothetical protein